MRWNHRSRVLLLLSIVAGVVGERDSGISRRYSSLLDQNVDASYPASVAWNPFRRSRELTEFKPWESPPSSLLPEVQEEDDNESDQEARSNDHDSDQEFRWETHESESAPRHSPVVYRLYSRNRSRALSAGSIPFVLIGRNVDHFKVIGQELADRGFSVLACERVRGEDGQAIDDDGALLIRKLLETLRWNRVVLVGCDDEASLAIQAALQLSPQHVVGLVLVGNLQAAQDMFGLEQAAERFPLDAFLQEYLQCPFTIVTDAEAPRSPSRRSAADTADRLPQHRTLILGGGAAPHRRRPEHFAWVLTRFVEEKIAPDVSLARGGQQEQASAMPERRPVDQFVRLQELLAPESLVVAGRALATALFYWSVMKVTIYQYDTACDRLLSVQSGITSVMSLRRTLVGGLSSLLGSLLVVKPRAEQTVSSADAVLERDNDRQETVTDDIEPPRPNENDQIGSDETITEETEAEKEEQEEEAQDESPSLDDEGPIPDDEPSEPEPRPFFFLDPVIA